MLKPNELAPPIRLPDLRGRLYDPERKPTLVVFFETDCPTCQLTLPYLNRLQSHVEGKAEIIGVSQDGSGETARFVQRSGISFPVVLDRDLAVTRAYDPEAVPSLFLADEKGVIRAVQSGFEKAALNRLACELCLMAGKDPIVAASPNDGAPEWKPGCVSRHREPRSEAGAATPVEVYSRVGLRASRIETPPGQDPYEYCREAGFGDALPVVPPTVERVERMLRGTDLAPEEIVARIPPSFGAATVEKIAANAVMAGCRPEMMRVLIPLIRAACEEKFDLHGIQGTTHFATPLVILNGPVREELGFVSGSNVFSNVARANSSLGRAFQLMLRNLGGARPGEIDMSTLGSPAKFSYVLPENEEASPWEPLHVELGFEAEQSTVTLFAAEPPRGVSEHTAREGRTVLKTIARTLATVWSYRVCKTPEAIVALGPEHAATIAGSGFSKREAQEFLFENTGIPVRCYEDDGGEGTRFKGFYDEVVIDGEACYRKFARPEAIRIVVAGGAAGKFSAVIGSWATGPRGSQMTTYPIP